MTDFERREAAATEINAILDKHGLIINGGALAAVTVPATTKPAFSAYSWNYAELQGGRV